MIMTNSPPSLKRNSFYNLAGHFLPLLTGLLLIPSLIQNLGMERFGIMTIVWAVIGYFSLFDFGLSRTITVKVSELQARHHTDRINSVFWTSMTLIFGITLAGSLILILLSFQSALLSGKASPEVLEEGAVSLRIIALTLPAITLTAGIKGALEANHQFLQLNILQSILGILNFLLPFLISTQAPRLFLIVGALSVIRYIFLLMHYLLLSKTSIWLQKPQVLSWRESLPLLFSGGWFTVTNVVGPLMVYFDRFFLAALIPSSHLAFYTTPFEIVNRLLIFPSSITRALFPTLAAKANPEQSQKAYWKSFWVITGTSLAIALSGIALGHWGLEIWLGEEFAGQSYPLLVVLLIGFAANSAAWAPFSLIQAFHRPDLSAKSHLWELPFYCLALYFLATQYGLMGAAMAWALRNIADLVIMLVIAQRLKKEIWKSDSSQL
jgi:O-antigen/teichoic acid export membrane protein